MGVPFSSQAYHQLPLLGVVPSSTGLQLSAWDRSAPLLVAFGFWLGLNQRWFVFMCVCVCTYKCMCDQRKQEENNAQLCVSPSGKTYT